jgi:hypothetical protein
VLLIEFEASGLLKDNVAIPACFSTVSTASRPRLEDASLIVGRI